MGPSQSKGSQACCQSSQSVAVGAAKSMVWSNSGLSMFDTHMDRQNANAVIQTLNEFQYDKIIAVWVVSRAINNQEDRQGSFEHWCVKVQAQKSLISIDFLEHGGHGAFGLKIRSNIGAELAEFLYFPVKDPVTNRTSRKKWNIVSSVTPCPLRNTSYAQYLDQHDEKLLTEMYRNSKKSNKDPSKFMKDIRSDIFVSHISKFCHIWTEPTDSRSDGYNPITRNCQRFAAELYQYLIGNEYLQKVRTVEERYQSPFDKKNHLKKKQQMDTQIDAQIAKQVENDKNDECMNENNNIGTIIEESDDNDNDDDEAIAKSTEVRPNITDDCDGELDSRKRRSLQSQELLNAIHNPTDD